MAINNKGEGTASSFLIATLIAVTLIGICGLAVGNLSSRYGESEIGYFENHDDIKGNVSSIASGYAGDYDIEMNDSNQQTDRTEDHLFWKAFTIVSKIPQLLTYSVKSIYRIGSDLMIPREFIALIAAIMGIVLITLVIKIIRGFDNI